MRLAGMAALGVAFLSAAAFAPVPQDGEKWQALAVRTDGQFGVAGVNNAASMDAARAEARRYCGSDGARCQVVAVSEGCAAVAYNEADRNYFPAAAWSEADAIAKAHESCRAEGYYCDSEMTACPFPNPH